MKPRAHNVISYAVTLVVFLGIVAWQVSQGAVLTPTAWAATALWCFHFARRTGESLWIHRYGKDRIPTGDVVTEYVYYWGFGAWNAMSLTSAAYPGTETVWLVLGTLVFVLAQAGNTQAHLRLRSLRSNGGKERVIPRGGLFERVSCPHYSFEVLTWVGFALLVQTWAALAFLVVASGILANWAHTRHVAYKKDFDGNDGRELYPGSRRALIPWVF